MTDIQPNKYRVTFECVTYQDVNAVRNLAANAISFMQENFVETTGSVEQIDGCEHPGVFAVNGVDYVFCNRCRNQVPVSEL